MKSRRSLMLLAIVAAGLAVPVGTALAVKPRGITDTALMRPTWDVFPGTKHDTKYTRQFGVDADGFTGRPDALYPYADGDVVVTQFPESKDVTIDVAVTGMMPNARHTVWFNLDGITDGDITTAWSNQYVGSFTTDEDGNGQYIFQAPAGTMAQGDYTYAVWINGPAWPYAGSLFVSENIQFHINPPNP